jgi:hypothetical protein
VSSAAGRQRCAYSLVSHGKWRNEEREDKGEQD